MLETKPKISAAYCVSAIPSFFWPWIRICISVRLFDIYDVENI